MLSRSPFRLKSKSRLSAREGRLEEVVTVRLLSRESLGTLAITSLGTSSTLDQLESLSLISSYIAFFCTSVSVIFELFAMMSAICSI